MKTIEVGDCIDVTSFELMHSSADCENLREFDCCRSVGIGDQRVAAIASGCKRLKVVKVTYREHIKDATLHSLAMNRGTSAARACSQVTSTEIT
uniref:Uncharacterized protein n=1 Tax=Physcomitrium patens TaxID=3218 RepID=A0A2K1L3U0_PHYPA|nr:hypothetical protein PHYPA_003476 [Physcomitrium patens]